MITAPIAPIAVSQATIQQMRNRPGFSNNMYRVNLFRKGFQTDTYDEPTYLTFFLDFDFTGAWTDRITSLPASPLFIPAPGANTSGSTGQNSAEVQTSAVDYLNQKYSTNIGGYLTNFVTALQYVTNNTPWYFQSITGLDELWAQVTNPKALATGYNGGVTLKIGCLEGLDMRIMQMAEFYQKAAYDNLYMRHLLPDNMKEFQLTVWVGEIRDVYTNVAAANAVQSPANNIADANAANVSSQTQQANSTNSNQQTPVRINSAFYMKFDCFGCKFDFSPIFSRAQLNAYTPEKPFETTFNINVSRVEVSGQFGPNGYTSNLLQERMGGSSGNQSTQNMVSGQLAAENVSLTTIAQSLGPASVKATSVLGNIQASLQQALNAPNRVINSAFSEIQRAITGKSLGNIYF